MMDFFMPEVIQGFDSVDWLDLDFFIGACFRTVSLMVSINVLVVDSGLLFCKSSSQSMDKKSNRKSSLLKFEKSW